MDLIQKTKDLGLFSSPGVGLRKTLGITHQLSILIGSGVPLMQALENIIASLPSGLLKETFIRIAFDVRLGKPFSEALSAYPKIFNSFYVSVVASAEQSGSLSQSLALLAQYLDNRLSVHQKIKSSLTYPLVVLIVALIVLGVLVGVVVPKFEGIYVDLLKGAALPKVTQFFVLLSHGIRDYWFVWAGLLAFFYLAFKSIMKMPSIQYFLHASILRIPKVGNLVGKIVSAKMIHLLSAMLEAGVPLMCAIAQAKKGVGNLRYRHALDIAQYKLHQGNSLHVSMGHSGVFSELLISMIKTGEESGQLPQTLSIVASSYQRESERAVATLTGMVEPLMILLLSLFVGCVVISLFLPLMGVFDQLGAF